MSSLFRTWPILIALLALMTSPWFQTPAWAAGNDGSVCGSGQANGALAIKQRSVAFPELLELLGYQGATAEHCDLCKKISSGAALPPALISGLQLPTTDYFSTADTLRGHTVGSSVHRARAPPAI